MKVRGGTGQPHKSPWEASLQKHSALSLLRAGEALRPPGHNLPVLPASVPLKFSLLSLPFVDPCISCVCLSSSLLPSSPWRLCLRAPPLSLTRLSCLPSEYDLEPCARSQPTTSEKGLQVWRSDTLTFSCFPGVPPGARPASRAWGQTSACGVRLCQVCW